MVPEIDVPGHVNAATHAYRELTPTGEPTDAYTGIEVGFSRLHADLPATGEFLTDVFADVAAMTPGEYVHIGGDEVLTMEADEYATLVAAASAAVRAAGKKVVGWQEIAHTPLEPGTVVQYWDTRVDPAPFVAAARAGAQLLMSPGSKAYLDMKYDATTELGLEWAGHIELRDAYELGAVDPHRGRPGGVRDRRRGGRLDRDPARPARPHPDAAAAARGRRRGRVVRAASAATGTTSAPGSPGRRRSGTASGCPGTRARRSSGRAECRSSDPGRSHMWACQKSYGTIHADQIG